MNIINEKLSDRELTKKHDPEQKSTYLYVKVNESSKFL